jgi:hypothetical protein
VPSWFSSREALEWRIPQPFKCFGLLTGAGESVNHHGVIREPACRLSIYGDRNT